MWHSPGIPICCCICFGINGSDTKFPPDNLVSALLICTFQWQKILWQCSNNKANSSKGLRGAKGENRLTQNWPHKQKVFVPEARPVSRHRYPSAPARNDQGQGMVARLAAVSQCANSDSETFVSHTVPPLWVISFEYLLFVSFSCVPQGSSPVLYIPTIMMICKPRWHQC